MSAEARLRELGITLPTVPAPVAAYLPSVAYGGLVFTAGQLPTTNGVLPATGKVGTAPGCIDPADAAGYARICALNALAAVRAELGDLDRVERVVKVSGFIASDPGFTGHAGVMNGASELIGTVFGDLGRHARTSVGVTVLPLDAPVEVELIVGYR